MRKNALEFAVLCLTIMVFFSGCGTTTLLSDKNTATQICASKVSALNDINQKNSFGQRGETLLSASSPYLDGEAIDNANWVLLTNTFGNNNGDVTETTTALCPVQVMQTYFWAVSWIVLIIGVIVIGFVILAGGVFDEFRGINYHIITFIKAVFGCVASVFLVREFLAFNAALVNGFLKAAGLNLKDIFDYMGNIGLAYYNYSQSSNKYTQSNNATDQLHYLLSASFVKVTVISFVTELFTLRLILIDILVIMAPLAALCFAIPQTRAWGVFWMTTFLPLVIEQAIMIIVVVLGYKLITTLYDANPITQNESTLINYFVTATYLLVLRVPSLMKNVFDQGEVFIESPSMSELQQPADDYYYYNENPNTKLSEISYAIGFADLVIKSPRTILDIHKFGRNLWNKSFKKAGPAGIAAATQRVQARQARRQVTSNSASMPPVINTQASGINRSKFYTNFGHNPPDFPEPQVQSRLPYASGSNLGAPLSISPRRRALQGSQGAMSSPQSRPVSDELSQSIQEFNQGLVTAHTNLAQFDTNSTLLKDDLQARLKELKEHHDALMEEFNTHGYDEDFVLNIIRQDNETLSHWVRRSS